MRRVLLIAALAVLAAPFEAYGQTRVTTLNYNARGEVISSAVVNPSGPNLVTGFLYDTAGNLIRVTGGNGTVTQASWDNARRVTSMQLNPSLTTSERVTYGYSYNLRGQVVSSSVGSSTTNYAYTPDGLISTITDPSGDVQRFWYWNTGLTQRVEDGEGRSRRMTYLPDGRLQNVWEAWGTSEQMRSEMHWYNTFGERSQFRPGMGIGGADNEALGGGWNPAFASYWDYDAFGRLSQVRYPSPQGSAPRPQETYAYNAVGDLATLTTRAGQAITYAYDASGRMVSKTTPEGVFTTGYNLAGEVVSSTGPELHGSGQWQISYLYDFAGRLLSETQARPGGGTRQVSYQYDAQGNRTRITWPDGFYVTYTYDLANRVTAIHANGTVQLAAYAYDNQGRLISYSPRTGSTIAGTMTASYEADGDVAAMNYVFAGSPNVNFSFDHDRSGRLVSQTISHADWRWSPADADAPASAGYAVNRLDQYVSVNATPFTYDLNGNMTSDGVRAYTWTSENRLRTVTGAGVSAAYSYDPLGRRVRKTVSGAVTEFLHAGDMEIADYNGQGQLLRRYIPGPGTDQRVAMIECDTAQAASQCRPGGTGAQTRLYFSDRLGSVMAVTNTSGEVIQHLIYTPFGVHLRGDAAGQPFRFTGQRYDPETGLHYYRARYYSADLGRFLSVDPIGYADQWNLYAYVHNDPLSFTDPTGMECVTQDDYSAVCTPPGGNIGTFTIPAEFNPGYIGPDRSGYHVYFAEASTASSGNISESIAQAVIDNPTPGRDSPATPAGVVNDAGISPLSGPHGDQVVSFTTQDSNGNTLVVNVTIPGQHILDPGYVAQAIVPGDNRTAIFVVGEGNARIQQGPGSALAAAVFQRKIEGDIRRGIFNSTRRR